MDACLSYQVADSLAPFWPVQHVREHPMNTATVVGQCNVDDEEVAPWCAAQELVLVTIDTGFRTTWVKSGLLRDHGVEVIVFDKDLKGAREQSIRITKHLPNWLSDLASYGYGFRVWSQTSNAHPRIVEGSKKKRSV